MRIDSSRPAACRVRVTAFNTAGLPLNRDQSLKLDQASLILDSVLVNDNSLVGSMHERQSHALRLPTSRRTCSVACARARGAQLGRLQFIDDGQSPLESLC